MTKHNHDVARRFLNRLGMPTPKTADRAPVYVDVTGDTIALRRECGPATCGKVRGVDGVLVLWSADHAAQS